MKQLFLIIGLLLLVPGNGHAQTPPGGDPYRGWGYLAQKLLAEGVSTAEVQAVYGDQRMPQWTPVPFSLAPRESKALYHHFVRRNTIEVGLAALKANRNLFEQSERQFKVNRHVVAAILLIESRFGQHTGREIVINRLSRLAGIGSPENIDWNFMEQKRVDPEVTREKLAKRATYLETTFFPEVKALFTVGRKAKVDILGILGSSAGAIGMPQFLPSAFLRFGADGNGDKMISLYELPDAIASTARYLQHHGWDEKAGRQAKKLVVLKYNKSDAYADSVLEVAAVLKRGVLPPPPAKRRAKTKAHRPVVRPVSK